MTNQTTPPCPDPNTLADYVLGKLDPVASSECEQHLTRCEPCIETINGLEVTDTFDGLVFGSEEKLDDSFQSNQADVSAVDSLMRRMMSLSKDKSAFAQKSGLSVDVVRLLKPVDPEQGLGRIDHYIVQEVLGTGSTGVVFRAVDNKLNRTVAIKILRPSLGAAARERFIAEARATANLNDSNIVTIFHVGEMSELAFIVMQWLPGETLEQRLSRDSILDCESTRRLGQQIAAGLAAAHVKGLVHRDIKPANLWITETDQVKILDFGLVRMMDEDPQLTCTGMIAGTPCFMSPEQSRGGELDARSDLFSLGCVMYQCLTGKLPFMSSNALATLQSIQRDQPVAPNQLDTETPEDISDLVMMLLEKSPWRRPPSAQQVQSALGANREDWNFNCDRYADKALGSGSRSGTKTATHFDRQSIGRETRPGFFWPVVCLLCSILGWGSFAFGPQIIRIATNQGEIEIRTNDPDVQIEVLKGGAQVQIVDLKTQQSLWVGAGDYQIRPMADSNSISIDREQLTLSRGEKVIVTVTKETKAVAESNVTKDSENQLNAGLLLNTLSVDELETALALRNARVEDLRLKLGTGHPKFRSATLEVAMLANQLDQRKKEEALQKPPFKPRSEAPTVSSLDPNHKLRPGDVVRVFVAGVTGRLTDFAKTGGTSSLGKEFIVRSDNTLSLPLISPVNVGGKNVLEVEKQLRELYVEKYRILFPEPDSYISVTLKSLASIGPSVLTEPVYDRMTFEECLAIVKYERDGAKLLKPIRGLMELASDHQKDELADLIWQAIERVPDPVLKSRLQEVFFHWCTDKKLRRMFLDMAKSADSYKWQMLYQNFIYQRVRLEPIHDQLCKMALKSNIKAVARPISSPTYFLAWILKKGKLDTENRDRAIANLMKLAKLAPKSETFYLEALMEGAPETEGLGRLVGEAIAKCKDPTNDFRRLEAILNGIGIENQKAALRLVATMTLNGTAEYGSSFLIRLPGSSFETIEPILQAARNEHPDVVEKIIKSRKSRQGK